MDTARFRELDANDILFIDSTHVAKLGSDVNYIFSEILPALRRGVRGEFERGMPLCLENEGGSIWLRRTA